MCKIYQVALQMRPPIHPSFGCCPRNPQFKKKNPKISKLTDTCTPCCTHCPRFNIYSTLSWTVHMPSRASYVITCLLLPLRVSMPRVLCAHALP